MTAEDGNDVGISSELDANKEIAKIVEIASDVYVHGKFPQALEINGKSISLSRQEGGFKTIDVKGATEKSFLLELPEQMLRDKETRLWWRPGKEEKETIFISAVSVKDKQDKLFGRISLVGVQTITKDVEPGRENQVVPIIFSFDIPEGSMGSFWNLIIKDREGAPQNIGSLINKMYGEIKPTEVNGENKKGIVMSPTRKLVLVDDTFTVSFDGYQQKNPKRIFLPSNEN